MHECFVLFGENSFAKANIAYFILDLCIVTFDLKKLFLSFFLNNYRNMFKQKM